MKRAGPGPIITDSGGFQVFSMGHGGVADEIRGVARRALSGAKGGPQGGGGNGSNGSNGSILATRSRRPVSLLPRWRRTVHRPEDVNGDARRRWALYRAGVRRVHAVSRPAGNTRLAHGAHASVAGPVPAWHAEHGPARPGGVRDRAGRGGSRSADGSDRHGGRQRLRRNRDRRLARTRQGADDEGRAPGRRWPSRGWWAPYWPLPAGISATSTT